MTYIALLRGINVGGNNKVSMAELKQLVTTLGHTQVATYINSGNVVFEAEPTEVSLLAEQLEEAILAHFGLVIKVMVITADSITTIAAGVPADWTNDGTNWRCEVIFLWPDIDSADVLQQIPYQPEVDQLRYLPGAVVWRLDRNKVSKSGLPSFIGTTIYKKSTARNINTVRALADMVTLRMLP